MYLADYHMHSCCSMDADFPLVDMAQAAVEAGLHEICLTDHCDMLTIHGEEHFFYDWAMIYEQLSMAREAFAGRLTIKMGLEFGSGFVSPSHADNILSAEGLDFVIGSAHNMSRARGGRDFYFEDFQDRDNVHLMIEDYLDCLLEIAQSPYYDVVGHVIYLLRYVPQIPGHPRDFFRWWDRVEAILRATVEHGKGIELNTYCGRTMEEWRPVLRTYRQLGGEILTLGSDAHHPENVGKGIREGQELAKACGFKAFCTYEGRKPRFHDL